MSSVAFGKIVPFGQEFVLDDIPLTLTLKERVAFFLCLIYAIALNTRRNCLEYILRSRGYRKVYIAYYTCEVVMEPFHKLGVTYVFYHIDKQLEIADDISLRDDEAYVLVRNTCFLPIDQRYGIREMERIINVIKG